MLDLSAPVLDVVDAPSARRAPRSQLVLGVVLLIAVIALDQATKAWAWRHVPGTTINTGSTNGMGGPMNGWFSGRVTGAVLDFLNFGVLCWGGFVLTRRPRQSALFVSGALMIAGWGSNLLDRLGMHIATAPGSVRGAVDFIDLGPFHCNVADLFIVGATMVFLALVACARTMTSVAGSPPMKYIRSVNYQHSGSSGCLGRRAAAVGVTVAVAICVAVSIGATDDAGLRYSSALTSPSVQR